MINIVLVSSQHHGPTVLLSGVQDVHVLTSYTVTHGKQTSRQGKMLHWAVVHHLRCHRFFVQIYVQNTVVITSSEKFLSLE